MSSLKVEADKYRRQFSANIISQLSHLLRSWQNSNSGGGSGNSGGGSGSGGGSSRWLTSDTSDTIKSKYNSALDKLLSNLCNFIGASNDSSAPYRHQGAYTALCTIAVSTYIEKDEKEEEKDEKGKDKEEKEKKKEEKEGRMSPVAEISYSQGGGYMYGFISTESKVKTEISSTVVSSCFNVHPILRLRCIDPLLSTLSLDYESITCALHLIITLSPHLSSQDLCQLYVVSPAIGISFLSLSPLFHSLALFIYSLFTLLHPLHIISLFISTSHIPPKYIYSLYFILSFSSHYLTLENTYLTLLLCHNKQRWVSVVANHSYANWRVLV